MAGRLIAWCAALAVVAASLATFAMASPAPSAGGWQVVVAAGDSAEPVFDNATRALTSWLIGHGVPASNIHRLTASEREVGPDAARASKRTLLQTIATLPAGRGGRCLVFLTSHGSRDGGVYLAAGNEVLSPDELARALAQGCGFVPTVAIISACYSGVFETAAMERPNRIILTAARADRPSFGCQADRTYTFFDECLLHALPKAATWWALYEQASACVRDMEERRKETPSEPQAFFGHTVRKLPLRFDTGRRRAPERVSRR